MIMNAAEQAEIDLFDMVYDWTPKLNKIFSKSQKHQSGKTSKSSQQCELRRNAAEFRFDNFDQVKIVIKMAYDSEGGKSSQQEEVEKVQEEQKEE